MNSNYVTGSFDTIIRQASLTAEEYMRAAVSSIDEQFGNGFAKANPVLVAAFMNAAALDGAAMVQAKVNGAALQDLANEVGSLQRG